MKLRFPVPIFSKEQVYTHIDLKKPGAKVLSDTVDVISSAGEYMGFRNFISGSAEKIYNEEREITDKLAIKSLVFIMPNKSAEYTALQTIIDFHNGEDYISGLYLCPMCGEKKISRKTSEIDTRDRISDLSVTFMNELEPTITIDFEEPSIVIVRGQEFVVNSISLAYPTLEHHHKAYTRYGNNNLIKYQLAVYAEALTEVNGEKISDEWRKPYGLKLFENIPNLKTETDKLSAFVNKYGIDLRLEKRCNKCDEVWKPVINTSNFFGSALQLR